MLYCNYLLYRTVKKIDPKGPILVFLGKEIPIPGYTAHPTFRVSRTQIVHLFRVVWACELVGVTVYHNSL